VLGGQLGEQAAVDRLGEPGVGDRRGDPVNLEQRRRTWMLVLKIAVSVVVAAIAALIVSLLWRPRLFAVPEPPVPSAAPSASADAAPPPLDNALPPPDQPRKPNPVP